MQPVILFYHWPLQEVVALSQVVLGRRATEDLLLARGLMGEGCIPIRRIREWVEATGFHGYNEVEIFSRRRWEKDQMEFLRGIMQAYSLYS